MEDGLQYWAVFGTLIGVFLYFLPALAANRRKHKSKTGIAILNFFLGWTFIGWLIALVWAYSDSGQSAIQAQNNTSNEVEKMRLELEMMRLKAQERDGSAS